jgi:glutamyl-tRNA reductase
MKPLMIDQQLFVAGLSHQTAPVQLRERFSSSAGNLPSLFETLRKSAGLMEAVVLSTCNRFEVYGVAETPQDMVEAVFAPASDFEGWQLSAAGLKDSIYLHQGRQCIQHLFRVASSLDSLVLGETEITGQVKSAYQAAQSSGATGKCLNRLFQKAFAVSKEVRTRSGIGRYPTSIGSISVELARQIFGNKLPEKTVLVIGAGKISETALRHLCKHEPGSILVANRSLDRARELARQFDGEAFPLEALPLLLPRADIVISSTSAPHYLLSERDFADAARVRGRRPFFLIDLAVPRDVDPGVGLMEGIFLYNVDQLSEVARQNRTIRQAEAAFCEEAILAEVERFAGRLFAESGRMPGCDFPRTRPGEFSGFGFQEILPLNGSASAPSPI